MAVSGAHEPVLVKEMLEFLAPKPGGVYVDGTLGAGGHALALLEGVNPTPFLLGMDRDEEILNLAKENLRNFGKRIQIIQGDYSQMGEILKREGLGKADGIYLDLGVSSLQLDRAERGFSFKREGPIDMRMDPTQGESALEKMEHSNEVELSQILKEYGEERLAPKIARHLLEKLKRKELHTTLDVAEVAFQAYPVKSRHRGIHPATRTFQALRIWVNGELECLKKFLEEAPSLLNPGGRLCIISYHSLEDRMVKHSFRNLVKAQENFKVLTKRPVCPAEEEIACNPRGRSAKLRALARVEGVG